MKLRNKKTGEMGDLIFDKGFLVVRTGTAWEHYASLTELNEEWEDYEEGHRVYYIDYTGSVFDILSEVIHHEISAKMKQIGNYFETKEEAEQAVEKLKAITRLNKCEFRFEGYNNRDRANGGDIVVYAHVDIPNNNLLEEAQPAMLEDLDILFGGEK